MKVKTEGVSQSKEMKEVLDQYSICYSDKGIHENLDSYTRNKRGLISILRKHPCWNEDAKAVVLEVMVSREIENTVVWDCKDKLNYMLHEMQTATRNDLDRFQYVINTLLNNPVKLLPVNESLKKELQKTGGFAYIAGQKTSKAVNKVCRQFKVNEHTDYESVFARLADALNPLSIPRKAVLSVHPCDYLQMSGSQNSWTSCHNIGDGGNANGTLSYLNDLVSMIFYTLDSGNEEAALYNRPKITRTVFCYNGGLLLQSRLYPKDSDTNQRTLDRMCVQSIFATCLKKPNLWKISRSEGDKAKYIHTVKNNLHYADYDEGYKFDLSYLKAYQDYPSMVIGHNAYCLYCGEQLDHGEKVVCAQCDRLVRCADCGAVVEQKYSKAVDGKNYCILCIAVCDHCKNNTPTKELSVVHPSPSEEISVCKSCRDSNYYLCAGCGEYHAPAGKCTLDGQSYCPDCYARLDIQSGEQNDNVVDFPDDLRRAG